MMNDHICKYCDSTGLHKVEKRVSGRWWRGILEAFGFDPYLRGDGNDPA